VRARCLVGLRLCCVCAPPAPGSMRVLLVLASRAAISRFLVRSASCVRCHVLWLKRCQAPASPGQDHRDAGCISFDNGAGVVGGPALRPSLADDGQNALEAGAAGNAPPALLPIAESRPWVGPDLPTHSHPIPTTNPACAQGGCGCCVLRPPLDGGEGEGFEREDMGHAGLTATALQTRGRCRV